MRTLPSFPHPILHIIFSRGMAGAERYCADLANRQAAKGDEVHVLGLPGAAIERVLHPGVVFHALRVPKLFRAYQLQRLVTRIGVRVAHAHLSPACKALARMSGSSQQRLAKIATLHVGYKPHQHDRLDGLICVNHAQQTRLGGYGGIARVVSNWLPLPVASAASVTSTATPCGRLRQELGLAPDAFVIGSVGRLDASKGMDLLIQAFRATAPADAALVIVGEGRQRAALEQLRGGDTRIHLPGFRSDVRSALQDFDLFVSASREESFGLALLEAMEAGLPVLSSATEGPREVLRGQPAQLVAPGSLQDLSAGLANEFAKRGGETAPLDYDLSAFEPAASLAQIRDFYGQVLARQVAPRRPAAELELEAGMIR